MDEVFLCFLSHCCLDQPGIRNERVLQTGGGVISNNIASEVGSHSTVVTDDSNDASTGELGESARISDAKGVVLLNNVFFPMVSW